MTIPDETWSEFRKRKQFETYRASAPADLVKE